MGNHLCFKFDQGQPAALIARVARLGGQPDLCLAATLQVLSWATNDFAEPVLKQSVDSFNKEQQKQYLRLKAGQPYTLYEGVALPIPCVDPFEPMIIPVALKPGLKVGPGGYDSWYTAQRAWWFISYGGLADFTLQLMETNVLGTQKCVGDCTANLDDVPVSGKQPN